MKKYIYIIMLALCGSLAITSCTEEEVKPKEELNDSAGGGGSTGGLRS